MTKKKAATKSPVKEKSSTIVCWDCKQPGMKQLPNAKPGWLQCPHCGATDCPGGG